MSVYAPVSPGLALAVLSGLTAGSAMLPMKFVRRWAWENTWLVFSCLSQVIIPGCLAILCVRDLAMVYRTASASQLAVPALLGVGWGLGNVLFGLSIAKLGLALGYAIITGSVAVLGTLLPLAIQSREALLSTSGLVVLAGVAVMAAGIAVSGWAGRVRELTSTTIQPQPKGSYTVSLLLAMACALLSPMLNYSFVWGHHIAAAAVSLGNSNLRAGFAVWPVTLMGGFLANLAYCLFLLRKNRTWTLFGASHHDFAKAVVMGVLWICSLSFYGIAAARLGTLGTSVGWGLVQAIAIVTADLAGLWSGEWAAGRARRLLLAGVALLMLATAMMAIGNHMHVAAATHSSPAESTFHI